MHLKSGAEEKRNCSILSFVVANNEFQGSLNVRFIYTTFKVLKFDFKGRTLAAAKQLLNSFLFGHSFYLQSLSVSKSRNNLDSRHKWRID